MAVSNEANETMAPKSAPVFRGRRGREELESEPELELESEIEVQESRDSSAKKQLPTLVDHIALLRKYREAQMDRGALELEVQKLKKHVANLVAQKAAFEAEVQAEFLVQVEARVEARLEARVEARLEAQSKAKLAEVNEMNVINANLNKSLEFLNSLVFQDGIEGRFGVLFPDARPMVDALKGAATLKERAVEHDRILDYMNRKMKAATVLLHPDNFMRARAPAELVKTATAALQMAKQTHGEAVKQLGALLGF